MGLWRQGHQIIHFSLNWTTYNRHSEKGGYYYISWVQVEKVGSKNESEPLIKRRRNLLYLISPSHLPCPTQTTSVATPTADRNCHGVKRVQELQIVPSNNCIKKQVNARAFYCSLPHLLPQPLSWDVLPFLTLRTAHQLVNYIFPGLME